MSFGKAALAFVMIAILIFAMAQAFLTTANDRTTDLVYQNDSSFNRTAELVTGVHSTGLGLSTPILVIAGILVLMGAFVVMGSWSRK